MTSLPHVADFTGQLARHNSELSGNVYSVLRDALTATEETVVDFVGVKAVMPSWL